VRKLHVGSQEHSLDAREEAKDEKEIPQDAVAPRNGGLSVAVRSQKVEELEGTGKDRDGPADYVSKNLPGRILLGKGLVQVVFANVGSVGFVLFVAIGICIVGVLTDVPVAGDAMDFVDNRFGLIITWVLLLVYYLCCCCFLGKEDSLHIFYVLPREACRVRDTDGCGNVEDLEIPSIFWSFVSVIPPNSLHVPRIFEGDHH